MMTPARGACGPFTLAVCAEMVFRDLPVAERVRRLTALDVQVEIWDWTRHDLDELVALRDEGAVYSSMTGYVRGGLVEPAAVADLLATAEESVAVAARLGIPRLNLHGTGLDGDGLPVVPVDVVTDEMWDAARATLGRVAALGEAHGVTFVLENLNREVDHPGVPFASAADCLALVAAVDSPSLRLMLDLYHAQIGEGNLVELCRRALPWIGEIQVADVPGTVRAGHGRDRLPLRRAGARRDGVRRDGGPRGVGERRPDRGGRRLPRSLHALTGAAAGGFDEPPPSATSCRSAPRRGGSSRRPWRACRPASP